MGGREISKGSIGRIAERIVANELEFHGFLVRDLNLEGLAANVDLLAAKDGRIWQIQVKGARYDTNLGENGWWYQYGYCEREHISSERERMFNRVGNSFHADVVVLVCVRSPREYKCIVLPVDKAEEAAQINLEYAYRTPKKDGSEKKPSVVWMAFHVPKTTDRKRDAMQREIDLLRGYIDKWDFDCTVAPSTVLSVETA
jgi:hypothetical protein